MIEKPGRWLRGVDGQLRPLSADPISQRLFLASEKVGQPNAFLARELADRIVDWLLDDPEPISESDLHDQVVTLVREFGHPAVALAYAQMQPVALPAVSAGWPRDVDSLIRGGLLDVESTDERRLADVVVDATFDPQRDDGGIPEQIANAARFASALSFHDLDGFLARRVEEIGELAATWSRLLIECASRHDVVVSLHLNRRHPAVDAPAHHFGPLFARFADPIDESRRRAVAVALARSLCRQALARVYWHVPLAERLKVLADDCPEELYRAVMEGTPIVWTFDRVAETISHSPGLSPFHHSVLLFIGCRLDRLVEQLAPSSLPSYLGKLATLTRLARSAARHRYQCLRAEGPAELSRGFLLERSSFVVVPIGLESAAIRLAEQTGGADSGELAAQIITTMREALEKASSGPPWGLVDSMPGAEFCAPGRCWSESMSPFAVRGLTGWDATAGVLEQFRFVEPVHRSAQTGTAAIWISPEGISTVRAFREFLQKAARHDVRRMCLLCRADPGNFVARGLSSSEPGDTLWAG